MARLYVSAIRDIPAESLPPIPLRHVIGDETVASEVGKGIAGNLSIGSEIMDGILDSKGILNKKSKLIAVDLQDSEGVNHSIVDVSLPQ